MKYKKYLPLLALLALFCVPTFISNVKADEAILVDSEIVQNSYLRMEMFLYQRIDWDDEYDYFLVEVNFWEVWYDGNIWRNVWYLDTYIHCYTSDCDILRSYQYPEAGFRYSPTGITVNFYGFEVPIWVGAGDVDYSYTDSTSHWTTDAISPISVFPAIQDGDHADYTIGFRVPEGAGFYGYASTFAKWYKFNFIKWTYLGGGGISGIVST
jgi:hypothetical protein